MDDQAALISATEPASRKSSAFPVTPTRPVPTAAYYFDPVSIERQRWAQQIEFAASLGFDAVAIASPFATDGSSHRYNIIDHSRLHERIDGADADAALHNLAEAAHRRNLSVVLDICLDRVAPAAPLTLQHPDWFVHANDGAAFCLLSDTDAVTDWWDKRIAAWQALGIDGFRCDSAHRVPAGVWMRLIAAAKQRNRTCCFVADCLGAPAPAMAALVGCGFDYALSSSCWWDGLGPWIADDLDRAGAIAPAATLTVPPGEGRVPSDRAISLAGFLGNLWMLNVEPKPMQAEHIMHLNALRQQHRALFEAPAMLRSPPGASAALFARVDAGAGGIALALAAPGQTIPESLLRTWLGTAFGGSGAPVHQIDETGALIMQIAAPRVITKAASELAPAETAVKAPRIAIEAASPSVEAGRFPVKRIVGEHVTIEADLICDGHGKLAADLLWRAADETQWQRAPMALVVNDRWAARFQLERLGRYQVTIETWIDRFGAFVDELTKKSAAGVPVALELIEGTNLVEATASSCVNGTHEAQRAAVNALLAALRDQPEHELVSLLTDPATIALMRDAEQRHALLQLDPPLPIDAERTRAGFASWYEVFPRSQSGSESRHGTFDDVIGQLPRIRAMGFDVLYFPPIHPIGRKNRKGRNNTLTPSETDPGSPYAIGSAEGGHTEIHPELGDFDDFRRLIDAAAAQGIEIALDFAIQCAPDHPWLREHPEWFDWRPDGTIRYAENPPKKYEDIVNVDFYAEGAMPSLWIALRDVVAFWVKQGVRIFRVDNPHTKPLPFWEWMIGDIRARNPEVMFLAEAFTKPKLMYRLAKLGFSQSYTYFTWRNTAAELRAYMVELTTTAPNAFFRPHFFVNTPDINPVFLQSSGRAGFLLRAALAATLSGLWGVYNGFELCEAAALPGREEYLDSEKYQLRAWDHHRPGNIIAEITALNRMRRHNPALQSHLGITFLPCSNEQVLFFEKANADRSNVVLAAISLDPFNLQTAEIELPLWHFGLADDANLHAEDLARDFAFVWHGKRQIVSLDPHELPYCIWRVRA
jgi:starch synthase (maltosyl-transferring)